MKDKIDLNTMSAKEVVEYLMMGFGGDDIKTLIDEIHEEWKKEGAA